ncbi:MAG: hypothetical protein WBY12_08865 [Hyphomicrobium sp.]|jgi:hypothetical protein
MQQPEHHDSSSSVGRSDEWARRLTIILGAPLALVVSGLALIQFL